MKLEFFCQIFEKFQISNFMKIRPLGAELCHAEGQMEEHDEVNSRFSQFAKAPKKSRVFFDEVCVPNISLQYCQINVSPTSHIYAFCFRY